MSECIGSTNRVLTTITLVSKVSALVFYAYLHVYILGNWVDKVVVDMMMKKDNPKGDIKLYLYSAVSSKLY